MLHSKIVSTGMYVPPKVVTNKDLESIMETSDEWIQQRSGIKERRWIEEGTTTCSMAVEACNNALKKANLKADDIDMIIFGCLFSDYPFPGTGVLLQRELGFTKTVPAVDIRNQCSGFLYGLSMADAWIRSGMYKRVLLVGSEIHSTTLDQTTRGRNVAVLFGDGAGAAIIESTDDSSDSHIIDTILHSEGQHAEKLALLKPSPNDFPRVDITKNPSLENFPVMDGQLVFKNAVSRMTEVVKELCAKNNVSSEDIDFVIAHQANMRINQMVMKQLKIPFEKTHHTLDRYGNTTMATIPITLDEAIETRKVKKGDLVIFVAFGSGFTWGASLLKL